MGGRLTAKPTRSGGLGGASDPALTSRAGTKALLDGEEWININRTVSRHQPLTVFLATTSPWSGVRMLIDAEDDMTVVSEA